MRCCIAVTCLMCVATMPKTGWGQFIVAHRGASYDAPENTLAAFRQAWEQGADAIEGDFYLTSDGKIVCTHDKTTKRVAPHQRELTVARSTLEQLRQLDVGSWKGKEFAGERMPSLDEVLATVPPGKRIFVEIKCGPEIVAPLRKRLAASKLSDQQIVIIAFDEAVVEACRRLMPQYKCNWLTSYEKENERAAWKPAKQVVVAKLRRTKATGLGTKGNEEVIDRKFVDHVHDLGCEFHVWTVNEADAANRFAALGVDSITTDRPALIRKALASPKADPMRELQRQAVENGFSPAAHWGWNAGTYTLWGTHSNRLVPIYTFGTKGAGKDIDLDDYQGANSLYRDEAAVTRLYGRLTTNTVNPHAEYLDLTNVFDIQRAALAAGKKHIFLVIFDGMDWQTARAAAIYNQQRITYTSGRGDGTHFQQYTASGTSQFGLVVTSPHNDGTKVDVDTQTVTNPGGTTPGGYDAERGGTHPWTAADDFEYLVSDKSATLRHAYTDSASAAASMTAGIKTYNHAINVDSTGRRVATIAHRAQSAGYAVGAVTSVPISHATPAAAYAHNVHRSDYQDLTRDMLGLPSISHPEQPLRGLDVLIGGGFGTDRNTDQAQGANFVPGNAYLTADDLRAADVEHGGRYVVAVRTEGVSGAKRLAEAAAQARKSSARLLGFYGVGSAKGHLPYQTADGRYNPTIGRQKTAEQYTSGDLLENPTLADMTRAALTVLEADDDGFWLMVEAGDVDWANHDNSLDNSIGAVNSGDAAVKAITDWVERHSNWQQSLMIVTADHGHYLVLDRPELLIRPSARAQAQSKSGRD